jgi:hypothetical protein
VSPCAFEALRLFVSTEIYGGFSYLSTEHDFAVLERGMAILTRIMRTEPLSNIIDHTATDKRLGMWLPTANPAELCEYVRKYVGRFTIPLARHAWLHSQMVAWWMGSLGYMACKVCALSMQAYFLRSFPGIRYVDLPCF